MKISNPLPSRTLLTLGAICSLLAPAQADKVELTSGDTLTGEIQSFSDKQLVLLSPLATEPLELKSEFVLRALFDEPAEKADPEPEKITLSNGDVLPGKILELDAKTLRFSTRYAGEFQVPRNNVKAIHFGITADKVIYTGGESLNEWTTKEGKWSFSKGTYTCSGEGRLAREFELPENVRYRFNLSWKDVPKFSFRFCAENNRSATKQNTYEFLFNSGGMQLRRFENDYQPSALIRSIPFKPQDFRDRSVDIDIRVNRATNHITLYIDGNPIGTWPDGFSSKASGNFVVFKTSISRGTGCIIKDFRISNWAGSTLLRLSERATAAKADLLVDTSSEQLTGQVLSISSASPNQRKITLLQKESDKPTVVPDRLANAIYLKQDQASKATVDDKATFRATLLGGGAITLGKPTFEQGKLTSNHAILGKVSLDRKSVTKLENAPAATTLKEQRDEVQKALDEAHRHANEQKFKGGIRFGF